MNSWGYEKIKMAILALSWLPGKPHFQFLHFFTHHGTFKMTQIKITWLIQLEERVTLDLGVVSSSPTLDVEITTNKQTNKNKQT